MDLNWPNALKAAQQDFIKKYNFETCFKQVKPLLINTLKKR